MAAMRSGLVHLGAWALATTAAVLLSWLGVSAVLSDSAFEPPAALPLRGSATPPTAPPSLPAAPPATAAGPSPTATGHSPTPVAERHPVPPATPATTPDPSSTAGTVRSYLVPGGRVAVNLRPDSAELVSAVPDPGWQLQMWTGDQWLRVDFTQGDSTNSVFVTWNGHPPDVQTVVR
jgi:hypothetical protein